jgi:cell division septum initiation protein DivIVA
VFRGYETRTVDAYVARVERCIERFEDSNSPTEAVRRALDRVGEQTATILQEAERSAEETTATSRAQADDRLQRAEQEAASIWTTAHARARGLDDDIERLWQERQRLIEATKEMAEALSGIATDAEARFPPEDDQTSPGATVRGAARNGTGGDDAAASE